MRRSRRYQILSSEHRFFDHLFILIFATLVTLRMADEWGIGCVWLFPFATRGFIRSGVRYSHWRAVGPVEPRRYDGGLFHRHRRSAILSGLAETLFQIALTPTASGVFAAIYYPLGSSGADRRPAWFSQRTRFSAIWVSPLQRCLPAT